MNNIYFLYNFNPYHNRRCIRYETLSEYLNHKTDNETISHDFKSGVNFNENDGVNASITYNVNKANISPNLNPNYLLVVGDADEIISRWYVVDGIKQRNGQYTLTLYRDSIADYYDKVITSPAFIEKATITDPSNRLIFNSEGVQFNQIKKSETLIKDTTQCNWIIGYLGPNCPPKEIRTTAKIVPDKSFTSLSEFYYKDYTNLVGVDYNIGTGYGLEIRYNINDTYLTGSLKRNYGLMNLNWKNNTSVSVKSEETYNEKPTSSLWMTTLSYTSTINISNLSNDIFVNKCANKLNSKKSAVASEINSRATKEYKDTNELVQFDNNIFYFQDQDKYYIVKLKETNPREERFQPTKGDLSNSEILNTVNSFGWTTINSSSVNSRDIVLYKYYKSYWLELTEISVDDCKFNITGNEPELADQPYKMFCIPYDKDNIPVSVGGRLMSPDTAMAIASAISRTYSGSQELYDLQLLPYCPLPEGNLSDHSVNVTGLDTTEVKDAHSDTVIGYIAWSTVSTWSFTVDYSLNIEDYKLTNELDMYRLCSPNYAGFFEFNPAKNYGINGINIDCTYKPHSPYIHLNPVFNDEGLFGGNFHDSRGLICSGDFSLPQTSDAWETYQIQNSTYNAVYDRQKSNLEKTQEIGITQKQWQVAANTVTGITAGAATGFAGGAGGIGGAIAGGLIGGGVSLAAGLADVDLTKQLNTENIEYMKKMYELNLQNIQAQPTTLSCISALNENNKYFPFIEYYTCTDEEREAFKMKLYYTGMTVRDTSTISKYLLEDESFIQGTIIRINIPEDNHLIETICNELREGVFIK